jgi:6,7-dimethyl-8-ribityllumazine synthase
MPSSCPKESSHATQKSFAIVISLFNQEVTDKLLAGALERLAQAGIPTQHIEIIKVPGAIEIPLAAKLVAGTGQYRAVICLGSVIRGDTDHYDYVCRQVSDGCQRVMLDLEVPIIFGVLTTENLEQAYARCGGSEGHKGVEAADAALQMAQVVEKYKTVQT